MKYTSIVLKKTQKVHTVDHSEEKAKNLGMVEARDKYKYSNRRLF
jgi:hypothetical protein